jgi:hypothetical protein
MHELIYLSQSKLRQFMKTPGPLVVKQAIGEFRAPFVSGQISIEGYDEKWTAAYRRLSQVKKSMETSDRAPRWYEDDQVEPGEWVEFESSMVYAVIQNQGQSLLFFTQAICANRDTGLLLYGSPNNLLSNEPTTPASMDVLDSTVDSLARFIRGLIRTQESDLIGASGEWLHNGAIAILDQMRGPLIASAYVEGWARVITMSDSPGERIEDTEHRLDGQYSQNLPERILIASPLYVQYSTR